MPPRLLSVAIVLFWLATSGWLFARDLWPSFRAGEPPPVAIDLADEAQHTRTTWTITRKGEPIGRASSGVTFQESDDTFTLHNEMRNLKLSGGLLGSVHLRRLTTKYRVTRTGALRAFHAEIRADVKLSLVRLKVEGQLSGEVHEQRFTGHGYLETSPGERHNFTLEPVEVSSHGSVLNPLHPVNRLVNVRRSQHWRMPLIDPLAESLRQTAQGLLPPGPRFLDAEVLDEPCPLIWNGREVACLLIEYRNEKHEVNVRIWVRASDGLVLQQEALQGDEVLVLQRD